MLRSLALICGSLALSACFPSLDGYAECSNGACGGSAPTSTGAAPSGTGTESTSGSPTGSSTSSSDGGGGPGSTTTGTTTSGDPTSSTGGTTGSSGGGGSAADPCLPPNDAPLVQAGALVSGTSVGTPYAFCMDRGEVTHVSYRQFWDDIDDGVFDPGPILSTKPQCEWKENTPESFLPGFGDMSEEQWDATSKPDNPISAVDFCDAAAYCAWAGKRLCGGVNGESIDYQAERAKNEWYVACSHDGLRLYSYNGDDDDDLDPVVCENAETSAETCPAYDESKCASTGDCGGWNGLWTEATGVEQGCIASNAAIVNLGGNVAEWVDVCEEFVDGAGGGGPAPPSSGWFCESRGGSCPGGFYTACAWDGTSTENDADNKATYIGFRCCWDAPEG